MSNTPKKPIKSIKYELKNYVTKNNIKCAYCGRSYDQKRKISLDHVVPKSSGRDNITSLSNLIVSCTVCNSVKKKSLPLEEFIKLNPKIKYFLNKYLNKMKNCIVNNVEYYSEISWIKEYL